MSEAKDNVKKKKGLNPLIIVIVVLVLVIIGLAAYFLVLKKPAANTTQVATPYQSVPVQEVKKTVWSAGDFLVNLGDTDADKYLKATINLAYDASDKKIGATLEEEKTSVQDLIIGIVMSKRSTDLKSADGMEKLKTEIVKKLNKEMGVTTIMTVYFSQYIIE